MLQKKMAGREFVIRATFLGRVKSKAFHLPCAAWQPVRNRAEHRVGRAS